jgi:SAM-dependent methyltransferase
VATAAEATGRALDRARQLVAPEASDSLELRDGYLDVIGGWLPESTGSVQDIMLTGALPKVYERWWRPAWGRIAKGVRGPSMEDEHRIARQLLELHPGDGVLDVACGTGNFTRRFARAVGPQGLAVGVDLSETMLNRAVRDTRAAGLDHQAAYVRAGAEELPFLDHTFDAACCFAGLNLMADPHSAIADMARVLVPGGRIALFTSAQFRTPGLRLWQTLATVPSGMKMFGQEELTGALRTNGFEDVRVLISGTTQFVGGVLAS